MNNVDEPLYEGPWMPILGVLICILTAGVGGAVGYYIGHSPDNHLISQTLGDYTCIYGSQGCGFSCTRTPVKPAAAAEGEGAPTDVPQEQHSHEPTAENAAHIRQYHPELVPMLPRAKPK